MVTRNYIAKEENRDFLKNNDSTTNVTTNMKNNDTTTNHDESSKKRLICHAGQCLGLDNVFYISQTVLVNTQTYKLK